MLEKKISAISIVLSFAKFNQFVHSSLMIENLKSGLLSDLQFGLQFGLLSDLLSKVQELIPAL